MARWSTALISVALVLVCAPPALAVPAADFTVSSAHPRPGQELTFTATVQYEAGETPVGLAWDFDDGTVETNTLTVTHTYAAADTYSVSFRVIYLDASLALQELVVTHDIVVAPNVPPTAHFVFSPTGPLIDQAVFFVSQSSDAEDQLGQLAHAWSFGDGATAAGQGATHAFGAAGSFNVTLTVTDTEGASAFESRAVPVSAPPTQAISPPPAPPAASPLRLISPFPIVRLSGLLTNRGADIKRLAVRAPKGVLARVRCRGRACPGKGARRILKGNSTRFKRFERKLRGGTVLEVLVSRRDRIGKYTRFRIRRKRAPKRTDRCLLPGASKGSACPLA